MPFSTLSPYNKTINSNAKIPPFLRPEYSQPGPVFGPSLTQGAYVSGRSLPTNIWYQNVLIGDNLQLKPSDNQRVYVIPYVIDFVGPIPGIRMNWPFSSGGDRVIQWTYNADHGLTLGLEPAQDSITNEWAYRLSDSYHDMVKPNEKIASFSHLGFHLEWVSVSYFNGI